MEENKAIIYYDIIVKNRVTQLEKGWKKAKEILGKIEAELPYENNIHKGSYIMDK